MRLLIATVVLFLAASALAADDAAFDAVLSKLPDASYVEKNELIKQLVEMRRPGTKDLLNAFLEGRLYSRDSDRKIFIVDAADDRFKLTDVITGKEAGTVAQDGFSKIGVNNQLRRVLRGAVAQFDLSSPDRTVRLAAVKEMQRSLDEENVAVLRDWLKKEKDSRVKEEIASAVALADLSSEDAKVRMQAVATLRGSLNPDVYNRLQSLVEKSPDGEYLEPNEEVRTAAASALTSIDSWRAFYSGIETLFFGLSLGSVLVLAGIGLAITFGVMGVINMAHGELMMLGAYTTYVMQLLMPQHIGASIILAIPAAFFVSGLMGVLIERGIVRFLYGRPLETLLATFGVSLILQQLVRDIFSANNRPVETPQWMAGSLQFNAALSITYIRLYIIIFTLAVFAILLLTLKRTRLGLEVRAVSQNRNMAKAMGIRTEWVDALTFGLGSGIAGVAGVALSQLTNVGPNLGQSYIVDSFMVVVFGGVGNLWGTQIGGASLGIINKLLEPYSGAVLAKIFVLIFLILFIQRRPRGLFPKKGRAAEG